MSRLIDADAMREDWLYNGQNEYVYDTNAVLDSIDEQPTIDPESLRRHAKWIFVREYKKCGAYCSSCMFPVWTGTNYCPHCGAIMDLEDDK